MMLTRLRLLPTVMVVEVKSIVSSLMSNKVVQHMDKWKSIGMYNSFLIQAVAWQDIGYSQDLPNLGTMLIALLQKIFVDFRHLISNMVLGQLLSLHLSSIQQLI